MQIDFKQINKELRLKALELYFNANAGHIACSLSCIDIVSAIILHHKNPKEDFILSKGHAAVALYVTLNKAGILSDKNLESFYKNGTKLAAHPSPQFITEIPFATGSLGHGLPIANGLAKSDKLNKNNQFTYVLMSDGETNEGSVWEAAHFAVQHKLDNLIALIDKNNIQGFGKTQDVLGDTANFDVWEKIGFEIYEIDGHNPDEIIKTIELAKNSQNDKPKLIIANTIKGKGVSFMENTIDWHYWPMDEEKYKIAINDISNL